MRIDMDVCHLKSIAEVRSFITGSKRVVLKAKTVEDKYEVISELVQHFDYLQLPKRDKQIILGNKDKIGCYSLRLRLSS